MLVLLLLLTIADFHLSQTHSCCFHYYCCALGFSDRFSPRTLSADTFFFNLLVAFETVCDLLSFPALFVCLFVRFSSCCCWIFSQFFQNKFDFSFFTKFAHPHSFTFQFSFSHSHTCTHTHTYSFATFALASTFRYWKYIRMPDRFFF